MMNRLNLGFYSHINNQLAHQLCSNLFAWRAKTNEVHSHVTHRVWASVYVRWSMFNCVQ